MKENNTSKKTTSQETSTSTQSNQSRIYAKSLLQDHYSEAEEREVEQFECIELKGRYEPIRLIGEEGKYTMCLGNSAVWDKPIKSKKEAEMLLDRMPIKLMLLMNCVYGKYMDEYLKSVSEAKEPKEV
nr:MAG TPA: hypothetical protein [Microviridae sp.]